MRRWIPIFLWCAAIGIGVFGVVRIAFGIADAAPLANRFAITFQNAEVTGVRCEPISATFVEGATVWRLPCESRGSPSPSLVRLDMDRGQATIYTMPQPYSGFVMAGNNDLYGAAFAPDDANENIFFYVDRRSGSVPFYQTIAFTLFNKSTGVFTELPQPTDSRMTVRGLDWIGGQPEMIAEVIPSYDAAFEDGVNTLIPPTRFAYVNGDWVTTPVSLPAECERCLLQVAYRENNSWRLLWLNAPPLEADVPDDTPFLTLTPQEFPRERVLLSDMSGNVLPLDLPQNRPGDNQDDIIIQIFSGVFYPSVGNIYRNTQSVIPTVQGDQPVSGYRHYHYEDGVWQLARLPNPEAFPEESQEAIQSYFLDYGAPQSIPDTNTPYIYNAWVELPGRDDGLLTTFGSDDWVISRYTNAAFPIPRTFYVQNTNGGNLRAASSEELLLPELGWQFAIRDPQGGYYISSLATFAYIHVDAEINRVNPPNAVDHLVRRLLTPAAGVNPRDAALIVLIGLPIVALIALLLRKRLDQWLWAAVPLLFLALLILNERALAQFILML